MKWLRLKVLILLPSIGLISLLVNCSFPGDSNGSGVGNGMICGKLYEPDGKTPAVGAIVTLWERKETTQTDSSSQMQPSTAVVQSRTDENGMYSIDRVRSGMCAIEALDDVENIVSIDIPNEWASLDSLIDTLKAPGAIRGSINVDTGWIGCLGTYPRMCQISNGSFFISPLSEGFYLLTTRDGQMLQVRVSSGDTTNVKIEVLEKLEKPPIVEKISILYDSSKHSTIVNWDVVKLNDYWNVVKAPILGCNLYRRLVGDSVFGQPLNGSELIHDTKFIDTTAFSGSEYQYTVEAVDSAHRAGPLSEIVSISTCDIVVDLDTLTKLIEPGCSRIERCYIIQSHDPKSIDLVIGPSTVPSWQIQKYDATEGRLVSSPLLLPNYTGGWIKTAGDQIFYLKPFDTTLSPSTIVCMDKTGNERIFESFTWPDRPEDFDVLGNTIAIASSTAWNKQDSSANNYKITRSLTSDGMVVYSIIMGYIGSCGFRDILICADGTITMFFSDHILKLDTFGKEIATINLPPKINQPYEYSDTLYMATSCYDSNGELIWEFSVYDLYSVLLYKVKIKANKSLYPYHLATNGDIYLQSYDKLTEKTIIYRLPNPLHNNR